MGALLQGSKASRKRYIEQPRSTRWLKWTPGGTLTPSQAMSPARIAIDTAWARERAISFRMTWRV